MLSLNFFVNFATNSSKVLIWSLCSNFSVDGTWVWCKGEQISGGGGMQRGFILHGKRRREGTSDSHLLVSRRCHSSTWKHGHGWVSTFFKSIFMLSFICLYVSCLLEKLRFLLHLLLAAFGSLQFYSFTSGRYGFFERFNNSVELSTPTHFYISRRTFSSQYIRISGFNELCNSCYYNS